ncbi:MAG: class I SAM-dependent methyltransferase [Actinobacteria bacterium]|nr:class I SAM-dependent methyltransferase [Actinomycetota bacterium]MBW3614205.1 class I SAM-dependent methyltransferase [Actinomycetota bacterium]
MGTGAHYDEGFYAAQREGSLRSARSIVPLVIDALHPSSVVDVGCGVGTWVKVFREGGISDAWGIDGDYVSRDSLLFPEDAFIAADLADGVSLARTFDLAVSVEVAEHIEAERAERFVGTLTSLSPAVLFSAAIPRQGGASHVNERWPSYWARIFAAHGYQPLDLFRGRIWDDPNVEAFYAQNLLLYADPGARAKITVPECPPLDIVHPRIWEAGRPPTLRQIVQGAPEALRWSARHHLGRVQHIAASRGRSE